MDDGTRISSYVKIVALGVTILGLLWGGAEFLITKRLEAKRSYLDYQLELYQETAKVAAILANSESETTRYTEAMQRFLELYWGELVLVETPAVEARMSQFKAAIDNKSSFLRSCAYYLIHDLRASLSDSWDVQDWEFDRAIPNDDCDKPNPTK